MQGQRRRIGLRTVELRRQPDEWGESFDFVVNGRPVFAKGANWIPADAVKDRADPDRYRRLLRDAAAANMNMIRVWGGGYYEDDAFYDLCDEKGLLVWQDFMFACSTYPAQDEGFLDNVRQEAVDNVRRLRHHPSLFLWCGNNELEQGLVADDWTDAAMSWRDYKLLFDDMLALLRNQRFSLVACETEFCSPRSGEVLQVDCMFHNDRHTDSARSQ